MKAKLLLGIIPVLAINTATAAPDCAVYGRIIAVQDYAEHGIGHMHITPQSDERCDVGDYYNSLFIRLEQEATLTRAAGAIGHYVLVTLHDAYGGRCETENPVNGGYTTYRLHNMVIYPSSVRKQMCDDNPE